MKKTISIIALLTVSVTYGLATIRTVSNHPAGGAQYPLFINYTSGSLYSNLHDYDVQASSAGSAANIAATNGTDIV